MHYQNMEVFHSISLNFLTVLGSEMHPSNLELTILHILNTENVSLIKGYAKLLFAIFMFRCLETVTILLSLVSFLLINITGLEYAENPSFSIPM